MTLKIKRNQDRPVTVAVAGCVAQQEGDKLLKRYRELDLVFGPDAVPRVRELVNAARSEKPGATRQVLDTEFLDLETYAFASDLDPGSEGQVGAFVTIQKGCDNKCTFCIVPTTRGPEVSRPSAQSLEEVRGWAETGVKEITLIGPTVNSYGLKVDGERTAQLLYAVRHPRCRAYSLHDEPPRDMGRMSSGRTVTFPSSRVTHSCPVGSDRVLREWAFYTRERFLEVVRQLRDARPDIILSTDFIVGFPGETDEDFEETMSLLDEVCFTSSFSFKYSQRPGTPALRLLKDEVAPEVAQARLERLQLRQRDISKAMNAAMAGATVDVLVEGPSRYDDGVVCGRTSGFQMVFPAVWPSSARRYTSISSQDSQLTAR